MKTSTRALDLLGLLQARRYWPGEELARKLNVSRRTLRRDVDGLKVLGYPITAARGVGGGYQLSPGAVLPPLVLGEEEAAATVLGLQEIARGAHPASSDAAVSAIAKIVQVLPHRIRKRVASLQSVATARSGDSPCAPVPDISTLTTLALTCRDSEAVTFSYRARDGAITERRVEPHRVVSLESRLYLVAWDSARGTWRSFRVDRVMEPHRTGKQFAPRRIPEGDPVEFIRAQIRSMPAAYPVRATVCAPAEFVSRIVSHYGAVEKLTDDSCEVHLSADSLDWAAFCLGAVHAPFTVHEPPEAVRCFRDWGQRFTEASATAE